MENKTKKEIINKIEAERAVLILKREIRQIRYVADWVTFLDFSKTKLNKIIKDEFNLTAKNMMKKIRLEKIKKTIKDKPTCGSYVTAVER